MHKKWSGNDLEMIWVCLASEIIRATGFYFWFHPEFPWQQFSTKPRPLPPPPPPPAATACSQQKVVDTAAAIMIPKTTRKKTEVSREGQCEKKKVQEQRCCNTANIMLPATKAYCDLEHWSQLVHLTLVHVVLAGGHTHQLPLLTPTINVHHVAVLVVTRVAVRLPY